jgi:outer membrane cobalamin receptor
MKRYITPTLMLVAACGVTAQAATEQDSTLRQSMTLERDFAPIVRDADKIQSQPTVEQPTLSARSQINFADWAAQPQSSTDLTRLRVGRVFDPDHYETNRGLLDFRIGNYWNTDLRAAYYLIDNEATQLKVSTDWHATDQDLASLRKDAQGRRLPDWNQSYLSGAGAVELTRRREDFDWHATVGYTGVNHTLLGNDLTTYVGKALRQKTSDWNARLTFDNRLHEADIQYEAGVDAYIFAYDIPEENREVQERLFADVSAPTPLEDLRGGVKAEVELRQYQQTQWWVNGEEVEGLTEGVAVRVTPYVQWELGRWHLDLGARADFLSDVKHHLGIAPDVHVTYEVPGDNGATLYALVTGGVEAPSVRTLMYEMPFYLPLEEHLNPWTLTDATVGWSWKAGSHLRGKVFVGTAYTLDALVAYAVDQLTVGSDPQPNSRGARCVGVTTTLGNVDDLQSKAGAEVNFVLNKYLGCDLGATFYKHSEERAASQRANVDAEVTLHSHPVRQLDLALKYDGHYKRNAWYLNPVTAGCDKIEMDGISDLSLSGSWAFSPDLQVHADLRNLLNEEQETWLGAPGQKFNFQVGLTWKF